MRDSPSIAADRIVECSHSDSAGFVLTAEIIDVMKRCPSRPPTISLILCLIASEVRNALNVLGFPPLDCTRELDTAMIKPHFLSAPCRI